MKFNRSVSCKVVFATLVFFRNNGWAKLPYVGFGCTFEVKIRVVRFDLYIALSTSFIDLQNHPLIFPELL